jgi:hypothetical protein
MAHLTLRHAQNVNVVTFRLDEENSWSEEPVVKKYKTSMRKQNKLTNSKKELSQRLTNSGIKQIQGLSDQLSSAL